MYRSDELFYEAPRQYPESEFEIDGINVTFRYITNTMPHFDFRGDISETGYRSYFPYHEHLDQYGVEGAAREAIKVIRADFYKAKEKKANSKKEKYCLGGQNGARDE